MRHPQRDEQFWKRVCAEYRRGGQTRPELAARHGVSESTLNYHLSKVKTARPPLEFVPVQVASRQTPVAMIEVIARGGVVVRAEVGADIDYVARLVRALQS